MFHLKSLFPFSSQANAPRKSVPKTPSSAPSPDTTKASRIHTVRAALADIKISLDIRTFQQNLIAHAGRYCKACSRAAAPGTCGPTCALLRGPTSYFARLPRANWSTQCAADTALYASTLRAVDAAGDDAHVSTIQRWEDAVERLRRRTGNTAGCWAEEEGGVVVLRRHVPGLKRDWTFEEGWGMAHVDGGEEVAPDSLG